MKQFACGSVVAGCRVVFNGHDKETILRQVAEHARRDHGLTDIPAALVDAVRQNIHTLAA